MTNQNPKPLIAARQIIELSTSSLLFTNGHFEKSRQNLSREKIQQLAAIPAENRPLIRAAYSEEEPMACFGLIDGSYSLAAACENGEQTVICELLNIDHRPKLREQLIARNVAHDRALTPEEMTHPVILRLPSSATDQAGPVTDPNQGPPILPGKVLFDLPRDLDKTSVLQRIAGIMVSIHASTDEQWPVETVKKLLELLAELHQA